MQIFLLKPYFLIILFFFSPESPDPSRNVIRINQMGYMPSGKKVAVWGSIDGFKPSSFSLIDATSNKEIWKSAKPVQKGAYGPFTETARLDFSEVNREGRYYIKSGNIISPVFTISKDAYKGSADFLLNYMRQQRCGYNPFLKDSCHTKDGFTVYGPMPEGTYVEVKGGWHDATDYLQYVNTSANAVNHLLYAYRDFPGVFTDFKDKTGLDGKNGVADVLDEARWGIDWLLKMHPRSDWMFTQIADDRDHAGFRLPNKDTVSYRKGPGRPVYFNTGEPQGLFGFLNRTTGTSSTAGKFASAFAIGARIYQDIDPKYALLLKEKSLSAYAFGKLKPGYTQTAPGKAPYFYEEQNWVDDMELAAAELFPLHGDSIYLKEGLQFALKEPVSPWILFDTARHYQFYPFINIGHYSLAKHADAEGKKQLAGFYKMGIDNTWRKARDNGFYQAVPFVWCSNNLITSFAIQCMLYRKMTGDNKYLELETAAIDWLFGCNPWGTSMVIGLPQHGVYPEDPHSSLSVLHGYKLDGGLVDGPISGYVFKKLLGLQLRNPDEFEYFQSRKIVYHDDAGDYSTNEPTMDGTACLVYLMAALESEGR